MEMQKKYALTPIAGAVATALCPAQQAVAQDAGGLEEIIVTATKRESSIQDIPASIQAITSEALAAMGARDIDDYARFVPAVNVVNYGAGDTTVIFRGAITGTGYIAQSTSSVYLNEQSLTQTGAQPMIRMVDIERVEALAGPQGTLYGSDAQAGTMRIITNKPVLNEFEAIFDGEFRAGSQSDESYRGSLVFNVPMVDDTLAARVVLYNDHDGGFIDNVFGHTPDSLAIQNPNRPLAEWDDDPGTFPDSPRAFDLPAEWGSLDNRASVEKRWNDADVKGARLSLLWQLNDSWSIDLTALTQEIDGGAGNHYDPFVGDLQTVRFHDEWREDDYEMFSLVVNGDLGFADLVASVSYYEREAVYMSDITVYAHYWGGRYCIDSYYTTTTVSYYDLDENGYYDDVLYPYYWENPDTGYIVWYPVYCMGETLDSDYFQAYYEPWQQDKLTAEIRLSSQGDTIDWIVGLYRDESNDSWQAPFAGPTVGGRYNGSDGNLYQDSISLQYMEFYHSCWTFYQPYVGCTYVTYPEATDWWYADSDTDWEQTALFGEVKWHLSDRMDLTVGGRYFDRTNNNLYRVDHPGDLGLNGEPDTGDEASRIYRLANNNIAPDRKATETEFIPKISLSYNVDDDRMVYGLYTQGTRPGGVNRSRGEPFFSTSYSSDLMDNYELGYRSSFGDGRGRFNATAYHMVWSDYQLELTDPSNVACDNPGEVIPNVCGQPWQAIVTNAGEAHITGVNFELDYAINDNWVFGANATFLEAETDTTADLTGDGENDLVGGLRLPITPETKGSMWLDYTTPAFGDKEVFGRLQASYTGDSVNTLNPASQDSSPMPQLSNDSYVIADLRAGVRGDDWEVAFFINNLADERATHNIGSAQMNWAFANEAEGRDHFQKRYVARPRELGMRFMKRWGD
jgi:outer membrane receptor protein involved in Fe transport